MAVKEANSVSFCLMHNHWFVLVIISFNMYDGLLWLSLAYVSWFLLVIIILYMMVLKCINL